MSERVNYFSIHIEENGFVCASHTEEGSVIPVEDLYGLSRLNIFVGANNSGKSRLMRELMKQRQKVGVFQTEEMNFSLENDEVQKKLLQHKSFDPSLFFRGANGNHHLLISMLKGNSHAIRTKANSQKQSILPGKSLLIPLTRGFFNFKIEQGYQKLDAFSLISDTTPFNTVDELEKKGAIKKTDFFGNYVANTYKELAEGNVEVFSGQNFYNEVKSKLLGSENDREIITNFQKFLANNFFAGQSIQIIPHENEKTLHFKIGGEAQRPAYLLGDGVQNIILIAYKLFTETNLLFFLEEPENTLHPGQQRRLIETMLGDEMKERGHQYFISTHSNHLLDLTLPHEHISIFKLTPYDDTTKLVEIVRSGDKSVLDELGVQNSSVFLANKTIWVEGITDKMYISKYLELYQSILDPSERVREDIDFTFVIYGGNNIEHFSFLDDDTKEYDSINVERMCAKALLVMDKDGAKHKDERFGRLQEKMGLSNVIRLESREIENTLSPKSINAGIRSFPNKSRGVTLLPTADVNNRTYQEKPLGNYINKTLFGKAVVEKNSFAGKSGTIKDKVSFALGATREMRFGDLTEESLDLAKKIVAFVGGFK